MTMIENERQKLQNWMEEYALHVQLAVEPSSDRSAGPEHDFAGEPPPEEGQIRLWPAGDPQWPPLYGLLLAAGYAQWQVLPFSELSLPATPQEMKIREEPPVWVVQGWNARKLPHAEVRNSWAVDRIPEADMFRIHSWWLMLQAGTEPSGPLQECCGPPLRHPLDPRHDYLDAESCRADLCLSESMGGYDATSELKKAAEPERNYGTEPDPDNGP